MRLIDHRPAPQHSFPLVVMALGDQQQGEACHYYRTALNCSDHMSLGGPEIVFNSSENLEELNGITPDCLLAICEDRARNQMLDQPSMHLVVLQLQAARRALATDESSKPYQLAQTGGDSSQTDETHANVRQ